MAPFRFSVQAAQASSRREWVELVKRIDDAGFDMLVTADHLGGCLDPFVPLATAAETSARLRLGVMVLNNDFHHPSLLARAAATLDVLTDGRFEIGLGAGHSRPEYGRAGIPFDPPAPRVDRLEEAVVLVRRLLDGETISHKGQHYRLHEERCDPPPLQDHVPLLVGGGGKRVLTLAARAADTVGFTGLGRTLADGQHHDPSGFPAEHVDRDVAVVRAATRGRSALPEMQVLVQAVVVTDDARGVAESIVARRLPSLTADQVLSTPYLLVGSQQAIIDELVEQRERWGFSHYTVRSDAIDQFGPVVAALAGT